MDLLREYIETYLEHRYSSLITGLLSSGYSPAEASVFASSFSRSLVDLINTSSVENALLDLSTTPPKALISIIIDNMSTETHQISLDKLQDGVKSILPELIKMLIHKGDILNSLKNNPDVIDLPYNC